MHPGGKHGWVFSVQHTTSRTTSSLANYISLLKKIMVWLVRLLKVLFHVVRLCNEIYYNWCGTIHIVWVLGQKLLFLSSKKSNSIKKQIEKLASKSKHFMTVGLHTSLWRIIGIPGDIDKHTWDVGVGKIVLGEMLFGENSHE